MANLTKFYINRFYITQKPYPKPSYFKLKKAKYEKITKNLMGNFVDSRKMTNFVIQYTPGLTGFDSV